MTKVLQVGSVGTSSIMNVMQEAIALTEGLHCSTVYSRDRSRALAYAKKIGAANAETDYDAFVSRKDLDVIYIASPNDCHVDQAVRALSAGKHVLLEKPAALDRAGIRLLDETARANGVFWFEAITVLFMPNYLACKKLLPELGAISRAQLRYGQYSSKYDDYLKGIVASSLSPDHKGGALNDMGVYCIHPAVDLFGIPQSANYRPVCGPNGIDLEGICILSYPGFVCEIQTSKNRDIGSGCRIEGEHGFFAEDGPMNDFGTVTAGLNGKDVPIDLQHGENRMIYELAAFRDAINQKDTAFYERMVKQSLAVAGILEDVN